MESQTAGQGGQRVGPAPAPPPARLDTLTVMDLLATARRWRVREPFVSGQIDGVSRALVACLNAGQPVPRWLRVLVVSTLLETLWERSHSSAGDAWDAEVEELVRRWREPARG